MKVKTIIAGIAMLVAITFLPACGECVECSMGSNDHKFCSDQYSSKSDFNTAVDAAKDAGYTCK